MVTITQLQVDKILAHSTEVQPSECCGLIGGIGNEVSTVYPLRNVAGDAIVSYEAAPEDLFAAQRQMRERGEELLAIYHSHPRSAEPFPSQTDVRLAYYPQAVYFIIGLAGSNPVMRAFRISEREQQWQEVEYAIVGE